MNIAKEIAAQCRARMALLSEMMAYQARKAERGVAAAEMLIRSMTTGQLTEHFAWLKRTRYRYVSYSINATTFLIPRKTAANLVASVLKASA